MGTRETGTENVDAVLLELLESLDADRTLDRESLIGRHPEYAAELREFFEGERIIENLAGPVVDTDNLQAAETVNFESASVPDSDATTDPVPRDTTPGSVGDSRSAGRTHVASDIGEMFGRYRIIRTLGEGAMGSVHLAEDTVLLREVALKLPKFGDDEPELLERFLVEARAAANLRHPNICPVHDVGDIDGRSFITMAYIPGRPLSDYAKARPQKPRQVVKVVRKLAIALHTAHEAGIVHRDVKPANVMIDESGEPVVMDFGLARQTTTEDVRLTRSGAIMGTPAYMSPEQVEGRIDDVGPASDQFSLGAVLYEMLTGTLPFPGTSMGVVMSMILNDSPAPPSALRPEVDADLDAICLRMMEKDAAKRYESLGVAAEVLNEWLAQDKSRKTPPGTRETAEFDRSDSLPSGNEPSVVTSNDTSPAGMEPGDPKQAASAADAAPQPGTKKKRRRRRSKPTGSSAPPRTTPTAAKKPTGSRWPLIAGGLAGAAAILLGLVFLFRTPYGTLKITVDDPNLTVVVEGEDAPTITLTDGKGFDNRRRAGKHRLSVMIGETALPLGEATTITLDGEQRKVKLDVSGVTLSGNEFQIARNDETAVTIRLIENKDASIDSPPRKDGSSPGETLDEVPVAVVDGWAYGRPRRIDVRFEQELDHGPDEMQPTMDGSGRLLVFRDWGSLYMVTRPDADSEWGPARRIPGLVDGDLNDPLLSSDGLTLTFGRASAHKRPKQIFVSRRRDRDSAWGPAEMLDFPVDWSVVGILDNRRVVAISSKGPAEFRVVEWNEKAAKWGGAQAWTEPGMVEFFIPKSHIANDASAVVYARLSDDTWLVQLQERDPRHGQWRREGSLGSVIANHRRTPFRPTLGHDGRAILFTRTALDSGVRGLDIWMVKRWPVGDSWTPPAPGGHSLRFDGQGDRVELLWMPDWTDDPDTIEARVRVTGDRGNVFRHQDSKGRIRSLAVFEEGVRAAAYDEDGKGGSVYVETKLPRDRFVHLAMCTENGEVRLYVDGEPKGQYVSETEHAKWGEQPATIGGFLQAPEDFADMHLAADIDELRISKTARYDGAFEPAERFEPDGDTVALYHFDEGRGDTLVDASGNGHHGKVVGAKWVRIASDVSPPFTFPDSLADLEVGEWQSLATKAEDLDGDFNLGATWRDGAVEVVAPDGKATGRLVFDSVRGRRIIVRADVERLAGHTAGIGFLGESREFGVTGDKTASIFRLANEGDLLRDRGQDIATTEGVHDVAVAMFDGHAALYVDGKLLLYRSDCRDWEWTPMLWIFSFEGREPAKAVYRNVRAMVLDESTSPAEAFSFPEKLAELTISEWQPLATKPADLVLETNHGATLKDGAAELVAPEGRVDGRVVFEKVRGKRIIVRADVDRLVGHTAGLAFEGERRDYNIHGAKNRNEFTLGYRVKEVKQEDQNFEPPAPTTTAGSHDLALAVIDGHAALYLDGQLVMQRHDCEDWAWTPMLSNFNWEGKEPAKAVYRNLRVMVLDSLDSGNGGQPAPEAATAPFSLLEAKQHQTAWAEHLGIEPRWSNSTGMEFMVIPPGRFTMGDGDEAVPVELTRPYGLGVHEVTQRQWRDLMGTQPWQGQEFTQEGDRVAASHVSWDDANAFCAKLTEQEREAGRLPDVWEYRLPTEAEWEHACRAGTTTRFWFGDDEAEAGKHVWSWENTNLEVKDVPYAAQPVGGKPPNPWGLHDISGNVSEWCSDAHGSPVGGRDPERKTRVGKNIRLIRGGSIGGRFVSAQSFWRYGSIHWSGGSSLGFRVAVTLVPPLDSLPELETAEAVTSAADLLASGGWEWSDPENLGVAVNTAGAEFTASVSDDERTLVLMKYGDHGNGGWANLWCAIRSSTDEAWPSPEKMTAVNTERGNESNPQLSADGTLLIYDWNGSKFLATRDSGSKVWLGRQRALTTQRPEGEYINLLPTTDRLAAVYALKMPNGRRDLHLVERGSLDEEWGKPVSLGTGVNSDDNEYAGSMSDDRRTIVFVRNRDSVDTRDLYMSCRPSTDAPWSPAKRLPFCTENYGEGEPRLSPNGRVLAFTSNRPGGQGGLDVYVSRLVPKGVRTPNGSPSAKP